MQFLTFNNYLAQECKMLHNQMSALCFTSTALPTDDDALKQKKNNVLTNYQEILNLKRMNLIYLVFAECHHALVGCICSSKDVWRVVRPLHTMVQLRELREVTPEKPEDFMLTPALVHTEF